MTYYLIPVFILGGLLAIFGVLVVLGRFRKGRYLRPLVGVLSKVPFIRRSLEKMSTAALERQNPELASAMKKLQRLGTNPDAQRAQKAFQALPANEQRAYMEAMEEQGITPEPANRQHRRLQQRQYGQPKPTGGGRPKKRKKR